MRTGPGSCHDGAIWLRQNNPTGNSAKPVNAREQKYFALSEVKLDV
jgi:hypothetical protein